MSTQDRLYSSPGISNTGAKTAGGSGLTPNTGGGVAVEHQGLAFRRERFTLTLVAATVLAANDYGSVKLCDLPNSNLIIVGATVHLTAAVTGTGSALANVDFAIGTAATASTTFAGAGEKNVVPKIDCTVGGVIDGSNTATEQNLFIAAGASNALYLNVATGNISTLGSVTLSGTIEIMFADTGIPR